MLKVEETNMTKQDNAVDNIPEQDLTRRKIFTLATAVAAFGAAMGMRAAPAWAGALTFGREKLKGSNLTNQKGRDKLKGTTLTNQEGREKSKSIYLREGPGLNGLKR
jgi:hypothetical protein